MKMRSTQSHRDDHNSRRLQVLWLSPFLPYPPDHGGAVRLFNLIRHLSKDCDITLLALSNSAPAPESLRAMLPYCRRIEAFTRSHQLRSLRPRLAPPAVYLDDVAEMRQAIKSLRTTTHFDVLQIDYPSLAQYLEYRQDSVTCLTELDVTYLALYRRFRVERSLLVKFRRFLGTALFFYYELCNLPRFDHVVAMSEFDTTAFRRWLPHLRLTVIGNGVDCEYYASVEHTSKVPTLLFVGNFTHPPNVDAVLFFARDILPELSNRFRNLKFVIVGEPTPEIKQLASDRIIFVGRARNYADGRALAAPDIRQYYALASAVVVPMRYGSGTRLKLLEAFAARVPVVSTAMGAEGLPVVPEEHLLVANSPQEFVVQVSRLLDDQLLATRLSTNARQLVESLYDWKLLAQKQLDLYWRAIELKNRTAIHPTISNGIHNA